MRETTWSPIAMGSVAPLTLTVMSTLITFSPRSPVPVAAPPPVVSVVMRVAFVSSSLATTPVGTATSGVAPSGVAMAASSLARVFLSRVTRPESQTSSGAFYSP